MLAIVIQLSISIGNCSADINMHLLRFTQTTIFLVHCPHLTLKVVTDDH